MSKTEMQELEIGEEQSLTSGDGGVGKTTKATDVRREPSWKIGSGTGK